MMTLLRRTLFALIALCLLALPAAAQSADPQTDLTINDLSGNWRIEVIDRPNSAFKGTATIPYISDDTAKTVLAETITEDKCCDGKNHARVLQESRITITEDGRIIVDSRIVKYLLRIEGVDATYHPDDFVLRWENASTLIGIANGWTPVRWVRDEDLIS
jgi:hypothetical protein